MVVAFSRCHAGIEPRFTLATMASVTRGFRWHGSGDVVVQLAFFSLVFVTCFFVYRKDRRALSSAVVCYCLVLSLSLPSLNLHPKCDSPLLLIVRVFPR